MVRNMNNLVWVDLEMTGLDLKKEVIIEIAAVITDSELNIIAESPSIAIKQPDDILDRMDDWNSKQHSSSGLLEAVRQSTVSLRDAEEQILSLLDHHTFPGQSPMCGNSICQDRRFLARYMPELESFFHYRNLDVSTIKELAKRWAPEVLEEVQKQSTHRAINDIKESIDELSYYRRVVFNSKMSP